MQRPEVPRDRARALRRSSTDEERKLWAELRARRFLGLKFRRQVPIGPFIADFCCASRRLVIELDGSQHADTTVEDEERTRFLEASGYRVIRFWNVDVTGDIAWVLEQIANSL